MHRDEARIAKLARWTAIALERRVRAAAPPTAALRLRRALGRAPRWLRRKLSELCREHWDVAVFDVGFGSLKAFGAYPALYCAGLAWTIPLVETTLLNTQLWTAAYLCLRGRLRSALLGARLGVPLERLEALRQARLGGGSRDARIHRFAWAGARYTLRVRGSRLHAWLDRLRGRRRRPGELLQSELRRMLGDAEFRHRAEPLRHNPHLYEEVLLARLLTRREERSRLLRAAACEPPLAPEAESLRLAIGEGGAATRARLTALGDALRAAQLRLGLPGLCLSWLQASQRRILCRRMAQLEALEYRLLADLARGGTVAASPALPPLRRARERIASGLEQMERLVRRARRVASASEARRLALRALDEARARGVPARRAGLVAALLHEAGARPVAPLAGLA